MVDADRAEARIARLEGLIERLESVHERGVETYLADEELRAMTERWLEVAFTILGRKGGLPEDLANRLARAARQRNLLVHLYLDVDDRAVFASLAHLDDLRRFAAFAQGKID